MEQQHHNAKFAFFYMLSLVGLVFTAIAAGSIIFEVINQLIPDINERYYSQGGLRFGIAALIIATPIYYVLMWQINKHLRLGHMNKESGVRRWLTYLIMFVTSVVIIGWLIGTIVSFLDGELTLKFALKFLTVLSISAIIFTYYLYDIKRELFNVKDKIIAGYFYGSLILIIAIFTTAIFFVDSPQESRDNKQDQTTLNNLNQIDSAINDYYIQNEAVPVGLEDLINGRHFIDERNIKDQITGNSYIYEVIAPDTYKICANFLTSNQGSDKDLDYRYYYEGQWTHQVGEQCFEQTMVARDVVGRPVLKPILID